MQEGNMDVWGFTDVWNSSLLNREERAKRVRSNLWASELGKATIDIVLAMRGTEPTNPPNPRSLRKFEAGNIWEWIVSLILLRAGILRESQKWSSYIYPGLLEVTGKADFIAGGIPEITRANLQELHLPEIFIRAGEQVITYLSERYPNGLEEQPLEIKSCSAFMFEVYERSEKASKNHRIQLYHYLKAMDYQKGTIVYVSRDDCRMMEVPVYLDSIVGDEYKKAIEEVTKWYHSETLPPIEQPIVFDEQLGKFARNWHIPYSLYLTKLYGFKDQKEFDDKYTPVVSSWNRVLARAIEGKDMTDNNKEKITEMAADGFSFDFLVQKAKKANVTLNNNENV